MTETKIARKVGAPPTATRILRTLYRLGQVMGISLLRKLVYSFSTLEKFPVHAVLYDCLRGTIINCNENDANAVFKFMANYVDSYNQ